MAREPLPIDAHIPAIVAAVRERGAVVVTAEPGAGKTTRIPPALVDAGFGRGRVVVLQPRRIAARAAAARLAEERGDEVGGWAGYSIRFEARVSSRTRVLVVTEGVLVRMLQDDPALEGVDAVVLDEFHERSIHADVALALLREVRESIRPELKIAVLSATLDAEAVSAFLGGAPVVRVPGRTHPLEVRRLDAPDDRPLGVRAAAAVRRVWDETSGDVLVFLPGMGEIQRAAEATEAWTRARGVAVLPLHGELRSEEQDRALRPSDARRVILATNVAETSLTVPGVTCVVDAGYARVSTFDPDHGLDRLELRRVSRASAAQRAGRAGRLGPGLVIRLWTAAEESAMPEFETPEIRRTDLAPTVLELRTWGARDLSTFAWYEAPDAAALARADELLIRLGAIAADTRAPTALGRRLARVPAHPRLARILAEAHARGAAQDGALVAALISERDVLTREEAARLPTGPSDVLARADLVRDAERRQGGGRLDRPALRAVLRAREQFARAAEAAFGRGADAGDVWDETLLRAIFAGFPDRVAKRRAPRSSDAVMVGGRGLTLAPESVVRDEELFVVIDGDVGRRGALGRGVVREASAARVTWLSDAPGGRLREEVRLRLDEASGRVVAEKRVLYEDLAIASGETGAPDPERAAELLLDAARREPRKALGFTPAADALLARIRCLAAWVPDLGLPPVDDAALVDALPPWIRGATSLAELREIPLTDVILARLDRRGRSALDELAPESLTTPAGNARRIRYEPGKPPVLAVKLQEMFGCADTPVVAGGRVRVLLHLLAPGGQVAQVTQDLRSFWNTTYVQVRKDLRGRYPKHPWPEDPWTAPPTARAKRRGR